MHQMMCMLIAVVILLATNVAVGQSIDLSLNFTWEQFYPDEILVFTWSPDSQYIAFIDTKTMQNLYILNVQTKIVERKLKLPPQVKSNYVFHSFEVSWSPNGSYFALAMNGRAYVMDAQSGDILQTYSNAPDLEPKEYAISDVRWSQHSSSVAAFSILGYIYVFDIKTASTLTVIDFHGDGIAFPFNSFDWSSDSSLLAAATYSDYIGIWDNNGNPAFEQNKQGGGYCPGLNPKYVTETLGLITSANWSKDNSKLAVGSDIGLWICSIDKDHTTSFRGLDDKANYWAIWSPDGQWLASITEPFTDNCELKIFDATQDYKLQIIKDKICNVGTMAWSPNSQQLAVRNDGHLWIGTIISGG